MPMIFGSVGDESVLYTIGIVALSSMITAAAMVIGFRFISRNHQSRQKRAVSSSTTPAASACGRGPDDGGHVSENANKKKKRVATDTLRPGEKGPVGIKGKGDEGRNMGDESDTEGLPGLIQNGTSASTERDPFDYCEHIQGEVKKIQQNLATKKIQESMTADQMEEEREAQRKQLEAIFSLMQKESDKFGIDSMEEIKSQMKLYA